MLALPTAVLESGDFAGVLAGIEVLRLVSSVLAAQELLP
jgi:hypothetical protein